jgi:hypothetical protein
MDLPFLPQAIPDARPVPFLHSVLPTSWWSQEGWPDPRWRSGMNCWFCFFGENFVVMFGTKAVPAHRVSRHELQAWIIPPLKPVTLLLRVRADILVSNSIPFTFR